jgi:hypothetical protein
LGRRTRLVFGGTTHSISLVGFGKVTGSTEAILAVHPVSDPDDLKCEA